MRVPLRLHFSPNQPPFPIPLVENSTSSNLSHLVGLVALPN